MSFEKGIQAFIQRFKNRFKSDKFAFKEGVFEQTSMKNDYKKHFCTNKSKVLSIIETIDNADYVFCEIVYHIDNMGCNLAVFGPITSKFPDGLYYILNRKRSDIKNTKSLYGIHNKPKFAKKGCYTSKIVYEQRKMEGLE